MDKKTETELVQKFRDAGIEPIVIEEDAVRVMSALLENKIRIVGKNVRRNIETAHSIMEGLKFLKTSIEESPNCNANDNASKAWKAVRDLDEILGCMDDVIGLSGVTEDHCRNVRLDLGIFGDDYRNLLKENPHV